MLFREKLRWLREREGISQLELAKELSTPGMRIWQNRMSQLENVPKRGRESKIEPSLLLRIVEFYGCPLIWLLDPRMGLDQLNEPTTEYDAIPDRAAAS